MEKISRVYLGAFRIVDEKTDAETIMAGTYKEYVRATVETEPGAVPSLIAMCNDLSKNYNLEWRLLLFDKNGITELDKKDYIGNFQELNLLVQ